MAIAGAQLVRQILRLRNDADQLFVQRLQMRLQVLDAIERAQGSLQMRQCAALASSIQRVQRFLCPVDQVLGVRLLGLLLVPLYSPAAELATGGATNWKIVLPDEPTIVEKTAARELAEHLKLVTGAEFPTIAEKDVSAGATSLLLVGNTARAPKKDYKFDEILIPEENVKDLQEIPENAKNNLEIVPVRWIDQVLEVALEQMPKPLVDDEIAKSVPKVADGAPGSAATDALPH